MDREVFHLQKRKWQLQNVKAWHTKEMEDSESRVDGKDNFLSKKSHSQRPGEGSLTAELYRLIKL